MSIPQNPTQYHNHSKFSHLSIVELLRLDRETVETSEPGPRSSPSADQVITENARVCLPQPLAAGLGIATKLQTPPLNSVHSSLRSKRYKLQKIASRLLPGERVAGCMRHTVGEGVHVHFDGVHAHYGGLQLCGSVWSCPICSARINYTRRGDLSRAVAEAQKQGMGVYLVTFTLQHSAGDRLADLLEVLKDAHARMKAGNPWKRIRARFGAVGTVTATEGTHGSCGWHPHLHTLLFTARPLTEAQQNTLKARISARFIKFLKKNGRYASADHGVDLRDGKAASDYVTKWGLEGELTGQEAKAGHGRSPFQLLADYEQGDKRAGALFVEWSETMKGRKQLVWSRGLRDLLGLGVENFQEEEDPNTLVMVLTWEQWRQILDQHLRAMFLDVVEAGGLPAAREFLACLGMPCSFQNDRMLHRARDSVAISAGVAYVDYEQEQKQVEHKAKKLSDCSCLADLDLAMHGRNYEAVF